MAILAAPSALLLFITTGLLSAEQTPVIRMGMQGSPPWYVWPAQGEVQGPVVDIVNEAARRGGVAIEWTQDPQGPEHGLIDGNADLWPLMARLSSRMGRFPITESWLDLGYTMVTLEPCGAEPQEGYRPRKVSRRNSQAVQSIAAQLAPGAAELVVPTHTAALEALCTGQADAAVIAELQTTADGPLVPVSCRERHLCLRTKRRVNLEYGIGARPGSSRARAAALVLRSKLDEMIDDGTMAGILLKWGVPSGEIRALRLARLDRVRANLLLGIALGLVLVVAVLAVVYRRLLRISGELKQALLLANAGEQAKRTFLSIISHELRTPIHGVMGMLELIHADAETEALRENADMALESATRLFRTVDAVLQVTDLESGQTPLDIRAVDLGPIIRREVEELRGRIAKPVEVVVQDCVSKGTMALGDAARIAQVLQILLENAVKFTARGLIRVSCDSTVREAETRVLFSVSDTGLGIPAEARERIFEVFEQADSSMTRRCEGAGVGLAVAQLLVRAMHGRIEVESIEGAGSTFRVELPAA